MSVDFEDAAKEAGGCAIVIGVCVGSAALLAMCVRVFRWIAGV